ncbi:hypothetical protein PENSPDRAFT_660939 [Peniophora sp. CONT]|nr:hypothetical protein PENSPDRAFT_660939 [Peniophora sp. CONT]
MFVRQNRNAVDEADDDDSKGAMMQMCRVARKMVEIVAPKSQAGVVPRHGIYPDIVAGAKPDVEMKPAYTCSVPRQRRTEIACTSALPTSISTARFAQAQELKMWIAGCAESEPEERRERCWVQTVYNCALFTYAAVAFPFPSPSVPAQCIHNFEQ